MRNYEYWTQEQKELLKELFPRSPKKEIVAAFQPRSWKAIAQKATKMRIPRYRYTFPTKERKVALGKDLTEARIRHKMSLKVLEYKSGLNRFSIVKAEIHGTGISVPCLKALCDTLGLELRALPKGLP